MLSSLSALDAVFLLAWHGSYIAVLTIAPVCDAQNDSADSTKAVFTSWAAGYVSRQTSKQRSVPIAELLSFTHPGRQKDLRTLAVARNKYLDLLGRDPRFKDVQYLIAGKGWGVTNRQLFSMSP